MSYQIFKQSACSDLISRRNIMIFGDLEGYIIAFLLGMVVMALISISAGRSHRN